MERQRKPARRAQHRRLRLRQVKAETEAWERTDEEYREIEREKLDRRLALALLCDKSLFVGWFESLWETITCDRHVQRWKRVKHVYGLRQVPASAPRRQGGRHRHAQDDGPAHVHQGRQIAVSVLSRLHTASGRLLSTRGVEQILTILMSI